MPADSKRTIPKWNTAEDLALISCIYLNNHNNIPLIDKSLFESLYKLSELEGKTLHIIDHIKERKM